jgi:hypothetical protein
MPKVNGIGYRTRKDSNFKASSIFATMFQIEKCWRLKVRRCVNRGCARFHRAFRPEAEGAIVLPQQD